MKGFIDVFLDFLAFSSNEMLIRLFIIICFIAIIIQACLFLFHFKLLFNGILNGNFSSFDRKNDFGVIISFAFITTISVLALNKLQNFRLNFLIVLIVLLLTFISYRIIRIIQNERGESLRFKDKTSELFKPLEREKKQKVLEYFITSKNFRNDDDLSEKFFKLIAGEKLNSKIIYTGKHNKVLSYKPLILLFYMLLKNEHFDRDTVINLCKNNFLFEKVNFDTNETSIEDCNVKTLKKSFEELNFSNLMAHHEVIVSDLKQIMKIFVNQ